MLMIVYHQSIKYYASHRLGLADTIFEKLPQQRYFEGFGQELDNVRVSFGLLDVGNINRGRYHEKANPLSDRCG